MEQNVEEAKFSVQQKGLFLRNKHNMPRKIVAPATFVLKNRVGGCTLLVQPSSHTTVRAVRHTAVQQFEWSVIYRFKISSYPRYSSCLLVIVVVIIQAPAIRQMPKRVFAHSHAFERETPYLCKFSNRHLMRFHCFQIYARIFRPISPFILWIKLFASAME